MIPIVYMHLYKQAYNVPVNYINICVGQFMKFWIDRLLLGNRIIAAGFLAAAMQVAPPAEFPHTIKKNQNSSSGWITSLMGGANTPIIMYGSSAFFMCHSNDVPRKRYKSSCAIFKYFSLTFSHAIASS